MSLKFLARTVGLSGAVLVAVVAMVAAGLALAYPAAAAVA
jgi:hypothetical protein